MYKVVIVDDEWQTVHGLSTQTDWDAYNMEVISMSSNGQDVLDLMASRSIDLLITDVNMPKMDGLTLITHAKRLQPSLRCIIISAYSEFDYVKRALQMGVENYLLKPINESELRETLLQTLQNLDRDRSAALTDLPDVLAFRTNILDRWVNGTIQDFELFERAELLRIDLTAPAYRVALLDLSGAVQAHDKVAATSLLLELCRSRLAPKFPGEIYLDASFRIVVILLGERLIQNSQLLADRLRDVILEAAGRGIGAFASIGIRTEASSQVRDSYASALQALNYRYIDPAAQLFNCEARMENSPARQIQFDKCLREGNVQQAQLIVRNALIESVQLPADAIKEKTLPYVLQLIQVMIESGRIANALPDAILRQLEAFTRIDSAAQLTGWLTETIREAVKVIHNRRRSYHLLVRHTLDQVRMHYDTELSLKMLAAGFNVSSAYLGQLFKEETSKYFSEFLTETRLEASRTLLLETNLKISEITQRVGIANQSYFNRLFKKTYSLSPVEFRRLSGKPHA